MLKFTSSLRVRVLLIVLFAILPALVLFQVTNVEDRNNDINRRKQDTLQLAEILSLQEKELLDEARQLLITASQFNEVRHYDAGSCDQALSNLLSQYPQYTELGVANMQGDVICSAVPPTAKINISDRKYFQEAISTQEFSIGEYQVGRITHKSAVNLGYPIYDDNGNLSGVIYSAVDLSQLSLFEGGIISSLPTGSVLTKVDQNGIVLVRSPNGDNLIGEQAPESAVVAESLRTNQGIIEAPGTDGRPWIYAFVAIKSDIYQGEIHLILGQPIAVLFADLNQTFNRNLLIMIVLGALLLAVTWFGFDLNFMQQVQSLVQRFTAHHKRRHAGTLSARFLWQLRNQSPGRLFQPDGGSS